MSIATQVPNWVPAKGRQDLEIIADFDLSDDLRAALDRFTTRQEMRGVWETLGGDRADNLIFLAMEAYAHALSGSALDMQKLTTPASRHARSAAALAFALKIPNRFETEVFDNLWEGEPLIAFNDYINLLLKTAIYFDQLYKEVTATVRSRGQTLPRRSRKNRINRAFQIIFVRTLSASFRKRYDQPHDAVVADLVTVAFDLEDAPAAETIRSWCRER